MQVLKHIPTYFLLSALIFVSYSAHLVAQTDSSGTKAGTQATTTERDGQHDFDPLIGAWKYHLSAACIP
jgi:hypothetical protein